MFEELIRTALVPLIGRLESALPTITGPVRDAVEGFARDLHAARSWRPGAATSSA